MANKIRSISNGHRNGYQGSKASKGIITSLEEESLDLYNMLKLEQTEEETSTVTTILDKFEISNSMIIKYIVLSNFIHVYNSQTKRSMTLL